MPKYSEVRPLIVSPGEDSRFAAEKWAEEWLASQALRDLILAFGGPDSFDPYVHFSDIIEFSSSHWDFRRGQERNLALKQEFEPKVEEQVLESAASLGFVLPRRPSSQTYEHMLILGGLVRACFLRPAYAAEQIAQGVRVREVVGLGGFRNLAGDELDIVERLGASDLTNEIGALERGLSSAFELGKPVSETSYVDPEISNRSYLVRTYQGRSNVTVRLIAAPSTEPNTRRANSADTYRFWAEEIGKPSAASTILLVTSSIYVPYQGLEAVRILGYKYCCGIETVGMDTMNTQSVVLRQPFTIANYLQEINSTIRSIAAVRGVNASNT